MTDKILKVNGEVGLFSNIFVPTERPRKSDSGCYSLRSKTQPYDFFSNKFSKNIVKW
jgi:hypothetical protein